MWTLLARRKPWPGSIKNNRPQCKGFAIPSKGSGEGGGQGTRWQRSTSNFLKKNGPEKKYVNTKLHRPSMEISLSAWTLTRQKTALSILLVLGLKITVL